MIRQVHSTDVPQIIHLAHDFHSESQFAALPLSEQKIIDFVRRSSLEDTNYFMVVAENSGRIDGFVMGILSSYWFSDVSGAFDYCLYVVPEKRGSTVALRLWRAFHAWACERGAVELTHGVSSGINIESAHCFFTGMGMRHVGGVYKMQLRSPAINATARRELAEIPAG